MSVFPRHKLSDFAPKKPEYVISSPDASSEGRGPSALSVGAPRILIVEDDYLIGLELEAELEAAGFEVVGLAATAEDAVQLATERRPNLAIMDIRLRGKRDGVDAAIEMFSGNGTRCIFATAHYDPATRKRAEAAAPLAWLPKPYSVDRLIALIRTFAVAEPNDEPGQSE